MTSVGCDDEKEAAAAARYFRACSRATLQSEPEGFFSNFADLVTQTAGPDWMEDFLKISSDVERIRTCYTDKKVCGVVQGTLSGVQRLFRSKSYGYAKSKLDEAHDWLSKGRPDRALPPANLAIVRAPTPDAVKTSEEKHLLSECFWTRSEILQKMSNYPECIVDVQMALKHHLRASLKSWAYLRLGQCYLELRELTKCRLAVTVAQSCGGHPELTHQVDSILRRANKEGEDSTRSTEVALSHRLLPPPLGVTPESSELSGLSASLSACSDPRLGRHLIANRNISIGEYVAIEEPTASVLFFDKHGSHCYHCFTRLRVALPCPDCSGVAFCSAACLTSASPYHRWECPCLELLIGSGMSALTFLSLRLVTQTSVTSLREHCLHTEHPYSKIAAMESHEARRTSEDLLHRSLMALFLLQVLRVAGYFDISSTEATSSNSLDNGLSEDELLVCSLLLRYLLTLQYNAHELFQTVFLPLDQHQKEQSLPSSSSSSRVNLLGVGVFPSSSLFNHDCRPTLARYFVGRKLVLQTVRSISKGAMVCDNYGPIFTKWNRTKRQRVLSGRYLFHCCCPACSGDWPCLPQLDSSFHQFRCVKPDCGGSRVVSKRGSQCSSCGDRQELLDRQKCWEETLGLMEQGQRESAPSEEAQQCFISALKMGEGVVKEPNKTLCLLMDSLRGLWTLARGNTCHLDHK